MHHTLANPDAATLIHALNLLAQAWGGTVTEAQDRVERAAVGALAAAGGSLDGTDLAQRQLTEYLLRRDLDGFDDGIRQICRRSTIQECAFPNAGEFERWGFEDDGTLRSSQAEIILARKGAGAPSQAGLLAAVAYAVAMREYCNRKQNLLKIRTSASLIGYMSVKQSTEQAIDKQQQRLAKPRWQSIVTAIAVTIVILIVPLTAMWWLLTH